MKKTNLKNISLALASAVVFAGLGGITLKNNVTANAEVQEKGLKDIFAATRTEMIDETATKESKLATFNISDGDSVWVKRDLALQWHDKNGAQHFTTEFALSGTDFIDFTVEMTTPSAWATEEGKVTNVIKFTPNGKEFVNFLKKRN